MFRIESVRLAVRFTVRVPNERFPVRPMMREWVAVPLAGMVLLPAEAEVMLRLPLWAWTLVGENVTVALTVAPAWRVTGLPIILYGEGLNATE